MVVKVVGCHGYSGWLPWIWWLVAMVIVVEYTIEKIEIKNILKKE